MTIKIVVKNNGGSVNSPEQTFTLDAQLISIGSANEANVRLVGEGVAAEQAVIINENGQPLLINQAKGTVLNDSEIEQGFPHSLKPGDRVRIGTYNLLIEPQVKSSEARNGATPPASSIKIDNDSDENEKRNENFGSDDSNIDQTDFFDVPETPITGKLEVNSFADILSSLRQEEDQFYFQLSEPDGAKRRVLIEADETVLGWNTVNNFFTTDRDARPEPLGAPQAIVRKDWNGVTIYPSGTDAILINNALLEAGSRLKNGDKLIFSRRLLEGGAVHAVTLVFCEPAALIELNEILPQQLLSSALETNHSGEITADVEPDKASAATSVQPIVPIEVGRTTPSKAKKTFYFGYFTIVEIIIMVVATILTAGLTFLLLEFS